jgi:hypothetical protein
MSYGEDEEVDEILDKESSYEREIGVRLRKNPERKTRKPQVSVPSMESESSSGKEEKAMILLASEGYFYSRACRKGLRDSKSIFRIARMQVRPLDPIELPEIDDPQLIHLPFESAVLSVLRKIGLDFRSHNIELTPGEVFSMCIGLPYLSPDGELKVIEGTGDYLKRIQAAMDRTCAKADRQGLRFRIPDF